MPLSFSGGRRRLSNPFQQQTQFAPTPPTDNGQMKMLMDRIAQLEGMIRQTQGGGGAAPAPRPAAPAAPAAPAPQAGGTSRSQFIDQTYRRYLGRPASPEEMAGYTAFAPEQIVAVVSRSQEAQNAVRTGKNAYGQPFDGGASPFQPQPAQGYPGGDEGGFFDTGRRPRQLPQEQYGGQATTADIANINGVPTWAGGPYAGMPVAKAPANAGDLTPYLADPNRADPTGRVPARAAARVEQLPPPPPSVKDFQSGWASKGWTLAPDDPAPVPDNPEDRLWH